MIGQPTHRSWGILSMRKPSLESEMICIRSQRRAIQFLSTKPQFNCPLEEKADSQVVPAWVASRDDMSSFYSGSRD